MAKQGQKHMDESWVVKANRERDHQITIKSREHFEAMREEFHQRIREDQERDPGWFPVPPGMYELTDEQMADLPILDLDSVVKNCENGA